LDDFGYWTGLGVKRSRILGRLGYWMVIGLATAALMM
jgi:hypothetical protein